MHLVGHQFSAIRRSKKLLITNGPAHEIWMLIIWASMRENLFSGFANNKDADQPAHPHSLISAFVIRFLESIISKLATSEILFFLLVSVAEETGLNINLSETQRTGFVVSRPIYIAYAPVPLINPHADISSKARGLNIDLSLLRLLMFY